MVESTELLAEKTMAGFEDLPALGWSTAHWRLNSACGRLCCLWVEGREVGLSGVSVIESWLVFPPVFPSEL